MARLLSNSQLLILERELAELIGLNEAIVIQQIHYWLEKNIENNINYFDNRYWTYNSLPVWQQKFFGFWSLDTVKRTFKSLEIKGILLTANYNKEQRDRTKWYSIDYEKLESLAPCISAKSADGTGQNQTMEKSALEEPESIDFTMNFDDENDNSHKCNLPSPLPENNTNNNNTYSTSKKIFDTDSVEMKIVEFYISKILAFDKKIKVPTTDKSKQTWAKHIDYM